MTIKTASLKETEWENVHRMQLTQDRDQLWAPVNVVKLQAVLHFERSVEINIYKTGKYVFNFHTEFLYVITVPSFYCIYEDDSCKSTLYCPALA